MVAIKELGPARRGEKWSVGQLMTGVMGRWASPNRLSKPRAACRRPDYHQILGSFKVAKRVPWPLVLAFLLSVQIVGDFDYVTASQVSVLALLGKCNRPLDRNHKRHEPPNLTEAVLQGSGQSGSNFISAVAWTERRSLH
jgi:hypothetical protein